MTDIQKIADMMGDEDDDEFENDSEWEEVQQGPDFSEWFLCPKCKSGQISFRNVYDNNFAYFATEYFCGNCGNQWQVE